MVDSFWHTAIPEVAVNEVLAFHGASPAFDYH